jgi:hypothetical protein
LATFRRRIDAARRASLFGADRISTSSRLPGGTVLHRGLGKAFLRQAQGILTQVQQFAERTLEALESAASVLERPDTHEHADLLEVLDAHTELLAEREQAPREIPDRLDDLQRRVERLEVIDSERRWRPFFTRTRFESSLGGERRQKAKEEAASLLSGCNPVLNLTPAADALAALAGRPDHSLGAVVLLHADDHVDARHLVEIIRLAADKLLTGGRLVLSMGLPPGGDQVADEVQWRYNPTLGPPLPAEYVAFVCRESGFGSLNVQTWSPVAYLISASR